MPDDVFGDPVPQELRPSRKRQLSDSEQRTQPQRITDCLDEPLIYEMAELLPAPASRGCPRQYPAVVYVLLAALMTVTGSKRSAVGTLDTRQWRAVRASVRRNAGRTAAALLPVTPPSRSQYLYAEEKLLAPSIDLLQDLFEQRAVQQALHQGLFPDGAIRNWVRPERRQLLVGDATVPKAPSKAEHAFTVDTTTGEMRRHRVDPAARLYYETARRRSAWPGARSGSWPRRVTMATGSASSSPSGMSPAATTRTKPLSPCVPSPS